MAKRKSLIGVNNFVKETKRNDLGNTVKNIINECPRDLKIEDKENNNGDNRRTKYNYIT